LNRLFILFILALIWGCASRVSPTGGPKDQDPPKLLSSVPENGQKNYKTQEVRLDFNEFVTVKSLKEQLIITPRIDFEYSYKYKKRSVIISFEESLADSTTYTLNFREGIVDITEGLPAENLQLAFSTGNVLDTLQITGTIIDLLTEKPLADITVGLYNFGDTLDVFTGAPYYFAKTNKKGQYTFRNIKAGAYDIYAFKDNNKNLICQSSTEPYAFLNETIQLDTTFVADTMRLEYMNLDTLQLLRTRPSGRYFNVLANKYLVDAKLSASNDSSLYYHFDEDHKGLVLYNTFPIQDSLLVQLQMTDSLQYTAIDTFYLQFPETSRRPEEFKVSIGKLSASINNKEISGQLSYTKPINEIRLDSILIYRDSLTNYTVKDNFTFIIDSLNNKLEFKINLPKQVLDSINISDNRGKANNISDKTERKITLPYKLVFPVGSLYSIEQDTASAMEKNIEFIQSSKTGIISGTITSNYNSYTIQLLDTKYNIVQEVKNRKTYKFAAIAPGEYLIRILIDANNNGQWEHSNYRKKQLAEPLIIYKDETGNSKTAVRANWEITVDLQF